MSAVLLNPPDPNAALEKILRTTGGWYEVENTKPMAHYFMAKNNSLETAISLCGTIVTTISRLHIRVSERSCFVCDLYSLSRKEVIEKIVVAITEELNKEQE